jgi:glycosyltransferase involved in cell wall biosynthesis
METETSIPTKPRLLLTTYRREHLNGGLVEALGDRFTLVVQSVRRRARGSGAQSLVVSKKGLIADEARYFLRLCISPRLYKENRLLVCEAGHYSTLLLARLFRIVGARRSVFLLNFYLHELGANRWVRLVLGALLTDDVYVVAQAASDVEYFRAFLPAENVLYQPYCQGPLDLDGYDGAQRDFVFAGGWTNRDYDALFRSAATLPHIDFVVAVSARSVINETRPPNVEVVFDSEPTVFHRLMAESRLVVLPLKRDVGSSGQMVLLAAMQLGKPVVVSNIGAIRDYVADGVTALCYTPGDDAELARLLHDLCASAVERRALGSAGQQRYMERFQPEYYNRAVVRLIDAAASQRTRMEVTANRDS